jgi:hypothetical protein
MQINGFILDLSVSNSANTPQNSPADDAASGRKHPLVLLLAGIVFLESAAIAAVVIYLVIEILVSPAASITSALVLAVFVAIAGVFVAFIALNILRGNAWTRGATIVVQVLIAAVAFGSFTGDAALPAVGVALLVPVVVALALLFAKPVVAATAHREG